MSQQYLKFSTEAELMRAIQKNALRLDYLVFHAEVARYSNRGLPDLIICGHGILRWIECKGPKGSTTPEQDRWLAELTAAGQDVRVASSTRNDDFDEVMTDLEQGYERHIRAGRGAGL